VAAQESHNGEVVSFYLTPVAHFEEYDLEHNMLFHSSLTPLVPPLVPESHRSLLAANGITQSMSRKGNCWDNAVAESFFHSLKTELVHHCDFSTRAEAKQEIFEYIEVFYNRKRRHSANDYRSPADYEMLPKAA
jgi:hypothetical protein